MLSANPIPMPWTARQRVDFDGKNYLLQLRFTRVYKPYSSGYQVHARPYLGTDMAKNFASQVELIDPANGVDREVVISMNHPLRYHNDTIYQQEFNRMVGGDESTVLQVVNNTNWLMPYFAVAIGGLGLVIHFGMALIKFLNTRASAPARTVPPPSPSQGKPASGRGAGGRHLHAQAVVSLAIRGIRRVGSPGLGGGRLLPGGGGHHKKQDPV